MADILRFSVVLLFVATQSAQAELKRSETEVDGTGKTKCKAYYHVDDRTDKNPPVILFQQGLGGLSSEKDASKSHPLVYTLLTKEKFAVVNFDRPGILDKGVNAKLFDPVTQEDIITCAKNALEWAAKQTTGKVFVAGVSEGAQVILHAVASATLPEKRLTRVYAISTPFASWKDVAEKSCSNEAQFKLMCIAIDKGGFLTGTLREQSGASPIYWQGLFKAKDGDTRVRDLLKNTKAELPITFVHGTKDTLTPIAPVEKLQADLKDESLKSRAKVDFIWFPGRHGTDAALEKDLVTRLRNEAN